MANIIVRNYEHFNRSLPNWDTPKGKWIGSRAQYEKELAKNGFVSFEEGEKLAASGRKTLHKDYDGLSPQAMAVCKAAKDQADKKGNLKPSSRLIDGMKKAGVCFDLDKLPKHYRDVDTGGFDGV